MYTMYDIKQQQDKQLSQMWVASQAAFGFSRRLTNVGLQHVLNHGSQLAAHGHICKLCI